MDRQTLTIEIAAADVAWMSLEISAFVIIIKTQDFVLIVSGVGINIPYQVAVPDHIIIQRELYAGVAHVAYIGILRGIAGVERHSYFAKHVGGLAVEIFHLSAETVVEKFKLHADIKIAVCLPGYVLHSLDGRHVQTDVAVHVLNVIDRGVEVIPDTVVALLAP